jgi:hypothetical protein
MIGTNALLSGPYPAGCHRLSPALLNINHALLISCQLILEISLK